MTLPLSWQRELSPLSSATSVSGLTLLAIFRERCPQTESFVYLMKV